MIPSEDFTLFKNNLYFKFHKAPFIILLFNLTL